MEEFRKSPQLQERLVWLSPLSWCSRRLCEYRAGKRGRGRGFSVWEYGVLSVVPHLGLNPVIITAVLHTLFLRTCHVPLVSMGTQPDREGNGDKYPERQTLPRLGAARAPRALARLGGRPSRRRKAGKAAAGRARGRGRRTLRARAWGRVVRVFRSGRWEVWVAGAQAQAQV